MVGPRESPATLNPVSRQNMMGPSTGVMGVCKLGEGTFLNPRPYMKCQTTAVAQVKGRSMAVEYAAPSPHNRKYPPYTLRIHIYIYMHIYIYVSPLPSRILDYCGLRSGAECCIMARVEYLQPLAYQHNTNTSGVYGSATTKSGSAKGPRVWGNHMKRRVNC